MKGKKSYLAQRRRCVAGLAASLAVEAGGGVVAHGRRLQTVILLFPAAEREILPLPLSSIFFRSFFLCFVYQWLSLCPLGFVFKKISLPDFKLPLNLSFLSLLHYSLFGHFPLRPPSLFLIFLPRFKLFLPSLYFGSSPFRFVLSSLRFVLLSPVFLFFLCVFLLSSPLC
jgi:hypothetical protein